MAESNIIKIPRFSVKDQPAPLTQFLDSVKLLADEALKQALFDAVDQQTNVRDRFSSASHELTERSMKLTLEQLHQYIATDDFNNLKASFTAENRGAIFELRISAPNILFTEKDIMENTNSKTKTCAIPTSTDILVHLHASFSLPEEEKKRFG